MTHTATAPDWATVLDALETRLDAQALALAEGRLHDLMNAFEAPPVIGPVPAHLLDRADALWRRGDALTADIAALVWDLGERLAKPDAPAPSALQRPTMLDTRI